MKQLVQSTNLNLLFGELKPTFVSANYEFYGTVYQKEVKNRLEFPETLYVSNDS